MQSDLIRPYRMGGDAVSMAVDQASNSMIIDLKAYKTFTQMRQGLEQTLNDMEIMPFGTKVNIDIGHKMLSNKQIRELEDISINDVGVFTVGGFVNYDSDMAFSQVFIGRIDEIRIYDKLLTLEELNSIEAVTIMK